MKIVLPIAFALMPALAAAAGAEPTVAEILKLSDEAHGGFKDLTTESKLVIREPGQAVGREYQFLTISKGNEKRLVRFLAPGDVKGMGMLVEGRDTMYAFLPGFQRVRRLGTHVKNQSFMGSDASFEDMSEGALTGVYEGKLVGTEANDWVVELTLISGKEGEFPRRKVWIDKTIHQLTRIEDFDAKGQNVRSSLRTQYKKDEGEGEHYTPWNIKIVDHRRNDHSTEIIMLSAKVNQKVADDVFSQRSLVRGQ
jgi:outer membrane lipoprotein-sorting protein